MRVLRLLSDQLRRPFDAAAGDRAGAQAHRCGISTWLATIPNGPHDGPPGVITLEGTGRENAGTGSVPPS
jgi:hypothetical protein